RTRIDAWITHRADDPTVRDLLPEGMVSVVNTLLPQQGSAKRYPILEFHEAGIVASTCLDGSKLGVQARYVTQFFHPDPEWDAMQTLLDNLEARMAVREVWNGYVFDAQELEEIGGISTDRAGVPYASGGFKWLIFAEPA